MITNAGNRTLSLKMAAAQAAQKVIDVLKQGARVALHAFDGITLHRRKARVLVALE